MAGQAYLESLQCEDGESRVAKLVNAQRLFIGPWYVLADNILVSGESLLRNFQEGLRVAHGPDPCAGSSCA